MSHPESRTPVLVTSGTGKTGRRVAERLAGRGVPVRIGSRTAAPAFDWADRASWGPALDGVGAAYLAYYPDLAIPGADGDIAAFAGMALERGVRRLVLLSGRGEEGAERAEQALRDSGADWTVLRADWFDQNFSEGMLLDGVLAGSIALPAGDVGIAFVDADDIADAAVAALCDDGHVGETHVLAGPRLLTFADAAKEIARATGRNIRYHPVALDDFLAVQTELGAPPETTWLMSELFSKVLDGRNASLTDGIRRALGREPRDFAAYARDAASTGIWQTSRHLEGARQ